MQCNQVYCIFKVVHSKSEIAIKTKNSFLRTTFMSVYPNSYNVSIYCDIIREYGPYIWGNAPFRSRNSAETIKWVHV